MNVFIAVFQWLLDYAFYYPVVMSCFWILGGLLYHWRWERHDRESQPAERADWPFITLMVPCHNEGALVKETIAALARQDYPSFEIIAINDGSRDDTGAQLDALIQEHPRLRVIHLATNQGKAMALRMGALASRGEFLLCVDGDALLDPQASRWMIRHFLDHPRVGAVTGNPRIRNRSTALGKLQVGEFSSIIGLIKRSQRIYGRIFTVSGVIAAFRKRALQDVGYWSLDMITEDIDISWRLQMRHWDIRYEPHALCWILMPETLRGLWKQRLRWAQGGAEAMLRYSGDLSTWRRRRMWGILTEYALSLVWAYVMAFVALIWAVHWVVPLPMVFNVSLLVPGWGGIVLGVLCLLQFAISLRFDSRYEPASGKHYYWMIWYPLAYWLLNTLTSIVAFPKALFKRRGQRARWVSPDRGVS